MSNVLNLNFPEYKFSHLFLHATLDNFGKHAQHKINKWSMPNKYGFEIQCTSQEPHCCKLSAFCTDVYALIICYEF